MKAGVNEYAHLFLKPSVGHTGVPCMPEVEELLCAVLCLLPGGYMLITEF